MPLRGTDHDPLVLHDAFAIHGGNRFSRTVWTHSQRAFPVRNSRRRTTNRYRRTDDVDNGCYVSCCGGDRGWRRAAGVTVDFDHNRGRRSASCSTLAGARISRPLCRPASRCHNLCRGRHVDSPHALVRSALTTRSLPSVGVPIAAATRQFQSRPLVVRMFIRFRSGRLRQFISAIIKPQKRRVSRLINDLHG